MSILVVTGVQGENGSIPEAENGKVKGSVGGPQVSEILVHGGDSGGT